MLPLLIAFEDAPARLKRELDAVLALQNQIDAIEDNITETEDNVPAGIAHESIERLRETHARLTNDAEELYVALNIDRHFPDIAGLSLDFTRTLLLAHDAKLNVRKRIVGRLWEYDKIDQAVGGVAPALGMLFRDMHASLKHRSRYQNAPEHSPVSRQANTGHC